MAQRIIVDDDSGRFGNRLLLFANAVAHAIEHGRRVVNPSFRAYARRFSSMRHHHGICTYPPPPGSSPSQFPATLLSGGLSLLRWSELREGPGYVLIKLGWQESCDMSSPWFVQRTSKKKVVVLAGWLFRDASSVRKHRSELQHFFQPTQELDQEATRITDGARGTGDILLGLHIRRSDYRDHLQGRYFFELQQYRHVVERLVELVPHQDTRILVCSDERIDLNLPGIRWTHSRGDEAEDMFALMKCDLIAGPPSSFNQCASLLGNKPLYTIADPEREFSIDDFAVVPEMPDPEVRRLYWGS